MILSPEQPPTYLLNGPNERQLSILFGPHYTSLNDGFTKRLEDVNRYQDEKETGDKRPILESPSAPERKSVLVEINEDTSVKSEEEMDEEATKKENGNTEPVTNKSATNNKDKKKKNKNKKK
ncbi:hypothetical protein GLOIN_2v1880975 [Rhizophagus irregularis DAOM 181602=DAOM 197198]|uniref:Uncharacterized protein n=1 Tax=Rhizophagus irregularis (strain DAOM 181602 / DAOM 197198 / MUCL 43194) TaxID=747089 RepID=A0A2P4PHQ1_RHIID|nr:hypothetical protein GLOIN_2v1880975 [Rhizophagus irregularis DAOM 181602=DAOM 197198]POG64890.1 hypothetical protein GLOIN_2v1880975 [Rhizophagus irregularis DAOM 181602=DAOM 197198]|eukprot:XP_025171756.1 hypothetical protein GLOIN_2v1880975 [Rhizophagus irregularis DAOM 181602=DAOM 197198]